MAQAHRSTHVSPVSQTERLHTLTKFGYDVAGKLDLPDVLTTILLSLNEVVPCAYAAIFLVNQEDGSLELVGSVGPDRRSMVTFPSRVMKVSPGLGVTGAAFARHEVVVVPDVREFPTFIDHGFADVLSEVAIPLIRGQEIIGVLDAGRLGTDGFPAEDVHFLSLFAGYAATAIENAQLFAQQRSYAEELEHLEEELRARTKRLEILNEIGRAVSATLELRDLYETMYQQISRVMDTSVCFIALHDASSPTIDVPYMRDGGEFFEHLGLAFGTTVTSLVMERGTPLRFQTYEEFDRFAEDNGVRPVQLGSDNPCQSFLFVPLQSGSRTLGVLSVQTTTPHRYDQDDVQMLSVIASQAAIAIENARLFGQTQTVLRVAESVNSSLDLPSVLQTIVRGVQEVIPCYFVSILLPDFERGWLDIVGKEAGSPHAPMGTTTKIPFGQGVTGRVFSTGESLLIPDVREFSGYISGPDSRSLSELAVPMLRAGQVVGVLNAESESVGGFTERDAAVLSVFATHAAIAVENARLFGQQEAQVRALEEMEGKLRARAERLEIINEIGRSLSSTLDLHELYETIYRQISRVMDASICFIALHEPNQSTVHIQYMRYAGQLMEYSEIPYGNNVTSVVLERGTPLLFDTAAEFGEFVAVNHLGVIRIHLDESDSNESFLFVPMQTGNRTVGVMAVQSVRPRCYSEEDVQTLAVIASQAAIAIENAHLFAQTQTLLRMAESVNSSLDLPSVLDTILDSLRDVVSCNFATILLPNEETGRLEPAGRADFTGLYPDWKGVPIPFGQGVTGRVFVTGEPILVPDVRVYDGYIKGDAVDTLSELAVPMKRGDKVIGVVNAEVDRVNGFTERDALLLAGFATHAAIAVENARLFGQQEAQVHALGMMERELRARTERLEILNEIGRAMSSTLDLPDLYDTIYWQLSRIMDTTAFFVGLRTEDQKGIQVPYMRHQGELFSFPGVPDHRSVTDLVFQRGTPLLFRSYDEYEEFAVINRVPAIPMAKTPIIGVTQSFVYVPLNTGSQTIGVLSVQSLLPNAYSQDDLDTLTVVASQAAVAIEKGRLFAEQEKRIADLRRAEAALQESEERYRSLWENANDILFATDLRGNYTSVNRKAEEITGYTQEQLLTMSMSQLNLPQTLPFIYGVTAAKIAGDPAPDTFETPIRTKEGRIVSLETSIEIIERNGRPVGVQGIARDITERKRAEQERLRLLAAEQDARAMAAGALEASRLKSEFLANMSHELRTPLNAIIGFTEIIHDERLGAILPTYKEFLGDVLQSSQHLLQIINDVLDLSKIEAGRMQFSAELVDVARAVASSIETLQPLAEEKRLRVSYRVEPSMPAVETDPQRLMQILYNFLSNAIKFTPDRGKIKIRVAPEDADRFRIEVKDSGIGIDSADLPKLFGEFVQLDTGLQKKYQGTGLGLALTKRIVEAQGGEVGVSSEVGRGSVFYAILPLCLHIEADGPAEPTRPKYSAASPP